MMRTRLRPAYTPDQLGEVYPGRYDHTRWPDHLLRVAVTTQLACWFTDVRSVADLSCGDATIINAVPAPQKHRGDLVGGYRYTGPIEQTIDEIPPVDLFICAETLEHLDDPDRVLAAIRAKTRYLVLSTPDGETDPDANPEHYWGWDVEAVGGMVAAAGFTPVVCNVLRFPTSTYDFQIWGLE